MSIAVAKSLRMLGLGLLLGSPGCWGPPPRGLAESMIDEFIVAVRAGDTNYIAGLTLDARDCIAQYGPLPDGRYRKIFWDAEGFFYDYILAFDSGQAFLISLYWREGSYTVVGYNPFGGIVPGGSDDLRHRSR